MSVFEVCDTTCSLPVMKVFVCKRHSHIIFNTDLQGKSPTSEPDNVNLVVRTFGHDIMLFSLLKC